MIASKIQNLRIHAMTCGGAGMDGATELSESSFSFKRLFVTLQHTTDGKVKATIPPAGSQSSFFMRMKVK